LKLQIEVEFWREAKISIFPQRSFAVITLTSPYLSRVPSQNFHPLFSRAPSNKNETPQPCPNGSFEMEVLTVQSGQFCEGDSGGSVIEEGLA
jgi:hypothetical protein